MVDRVYGADGSSFGGKLVEVWDNGYLEGHSYGGAEEFGIFGELETICEGSGFVEMLEVVEG